MICRFYLWEENGTFPFFFDVTWVEIFGDVTSVVFGDVTSMAKTDFFGDVTANRPACVPAPAIGPRAPKI